MEQDDQHEPTRPPSPEEPPGVDAATPDPPAGRDPGRAVRLTLTLLGTMLLVYVLVVAKALLIPLVLALFFWFLINILTSTFHQISLRGHRLPRSVAFILSLTTIGLVTAFLTQLIRDNVARVVAAVPGYQRNLEHLLDRAMGAVGWTELPDISSFLASIDLASLLSQSATALANLMGNAGLVIAYLLFLFVEERQFPNKLAALFPGEERRVEVEALLFRIARDTRTYVGLKTVVSLMTAVLSYAIMRFVGLDYAEFWAILILVLNFIPNIGSLIATLLPSLLALVQFENLRPFAIVAGGVTAMQLFVANVIEPRLMGDSLNLSPLVILLSLVVWGTLWGIAGMFLCVPIMVILMIIFSHLPQTRPLAILLSRDGKISA